MLNSLRQSRIVDDTLNIGYDISLTKSLPIENGGTAAYDAKTAINNLMATKSISESGYVELGNLLLQWGRCTVASTEFTVGSNSTYLATKEVSFKMEYTTKPMIFVSPITSVPAKADVGYKYNSSKKTYSKVARVTGTSATINNLKYSTSYSYAVKAYTVSKGKTIYSGYSSIVKVKMPKRTPKIKLNKSSVSLCIGKATTIKASTYPTDITVKWKTSNKSIAKVSSSGKVTAVKKGTVTITGYFKYKGKNYKAVCKVTVKNPSISLNKTATVNVKSSITLKATTNPGNVRVTWTSSVTNQSPKYLQRVKLLV